MNNITNIDYLDKLLYSKNLENKAEEIYIISSYANEETLKYLEKSINTLYKCNSSKYNYDEIVELGKRRIFSE